MKRHTLHHLFFLGWLATAILAIWMLPSVPAEVPKILAALKHWPLSR